MARLAAALGFALGGEGFSGGKPWIVNLAPRPDAEEVKLLRPIRFSMRDAETAVVPGQILVEVGYAKVHSEGEDVFDKLPRTGRFSLVASTILEPSISSDSSGVLIEKLTNNPERSVFYTSIDAGIGYQSAMVTAMVAPIAVSMEGSSSFGPLNNSVYPIPLMPLAFSPGESTDASSGVVLGLEYGPRGKAVYLWFQNTDGIKSLRLSGPIVDVGTPTPNNVIEYNWAGLQRYTIVWNEALGYVEVYVDDEGQTSRVFAVPIADVASLPDDYFFRAGTSRDITAIYGQEGATGDSSIWKNIAVTTDVGYPIIGGARIGSFRTTIQGAHIVRTSGVQDPLDADVVAWFEPSSTHFANKDTLGLKKVVAGAYQMIKPTTGKTLTIYRDEPGILRSSNEGFTVQVNCSVASAVKVEAATGMGVVIYDGQTAFQLMLFDDGLVKTIGLRKKNGDPTDQADHFLPSPAIDWSKKTFRFVCDTRRSKILLFDVSNLQTPLMSITLNRATLPSGADMGWDELSPFVAFGHITQTATTGTFILNSIEVGHYYQGWESVDGLPTAASPAYTASNGGTLSLVSNALRINTPAAQTSKLSRTILFGNSRGAALEARGRIVSYRPKTRSGTYLVLDDGLRTYALSFIESFAGRFICVPQRTFGGEFNEIFGRDGEGALWSYQIDWTVPHTYRLERRPYDGFYVFVDDERTARIFVPEAKLPQLPNVQFSGTPTVGFGQFTQEGSESEWTCARVFLSSGFEVSTTKNKPDAILREELFGTQAIVVAYALDTD